MMENYLQILEESLHKKKDVLERIEQMNDEQEQIFKAEPFSEEAFEATLERKGMLIDELNKLDEGFESLYGHIKEQLQSGKEQYAVQIATLQRLISEVTEKSVSVQAKEARNQRLAETLFLNRKKQLQMGRRSSKAAMNYYYGMSQSKNIEPQFLDKKK